MTTPRGLPGQIWNVADDESRPAAGRHHPLPGRTPRRPPATLADMSVSFFTEEKRVSNAKAKRLLASPHAIRVPAMVFGRCIRRERRGPRKGRSEVAEDSAPPLAGVDDAEKS
jgi:hypothetical protein